MTDVAIETHRCALQVAIYMLTIVGVMNGHRRHKGLAKF